LASLVQSCRKLQSIRDNVEKESRRLETQWFLSNEKRA
jgi:hypothetical protein